MRPVLFMAYGGGMRWRTSAGDELEARRWADANGYGEVVWWPFGTEWSEVDK